MLDGERSRIRRYPAVCTPGRCTRASSGQAHEETIMLAYRTTAVVALALLTAAGCATYPQRDAVVEDARVAVYAARSNPQVATYAPVEIDQAVIALRDADDLAARGGSLTEVRRLAQVAQQRAAFAQETARARGVEAALAVQRSARDAQVQADLSRQQADAASAQAAAAQRQADDAQRQAAAIQAQAQAVVVPGTVAVVPGTVVLEPALADLSASSTSRGLIVTLNDGMFDPSRSQLQPAGRYAVQKLATFLAAHPERGIAVEGYTDGSGNPVVDRQLSEDRARTVRAALIDLGIDPRRIVVRGYGPDYPIASNSTLEGRRMNRRVEVVIADRGVVIVPRG
jgi:outer membrane protein OmpA-like peptidoglycan-associated protein